jgi:hypothetical protein
MIRRVLLLFAVILVSAGFQVIEPTGETPADPNMNITWPPPIYVIRGEFSVRGTANVPGMASYFLEYRRLNDDYTPADASVHWAPAILPSSGPVIEDVLGVWNTSVIPDGPYELRLTLNISGSTPLFARVSPLRLENNPPPFAVTPTQVLLPTQPPATATLFEQALPTLIPTPTAFSLQPEAVALTNANVRAGDNTGYAVIGSLVTNQRVQVVGRSSSGSGWWFVQLPNGRRGFVAPSVIQVSGNLSSLPRIDPPATPTPVATPTPPLPDAVLINGRFDRDIKEGENFNMVVTVRNESPVFLPRISVACNITPQNAFYSTFIDGLNGFSQIDVYMVGRLDEGGGQRVTANCAADVNNLVAELDENNNFYNFSQNLDEP